MLKIAKFVRLSFSSALIGFMLEVCLFVMSGVPARASLVCSTASAPGNGNANELAVAILPMLPINSALTTLTLKGMPWHVMVVALYPQNKWLPI